MRSKLSKFILAAALLLPTLAAAEPVTLKLSFFTSDRSLIYQTLIHPFVDAVNREGKGIVDIEVFFSGAISGVQSEQPQLVSDGTADLALIVPERTPDRFPDTAIIELPGLFKDSVEATRVYQRLAERGVLAGYQDYYVIGAFASEPEGINSRKPIASVADLKGLKVRVNNNVEAEVLERLGAIPVLLAINKTTEAVSQGMIEAAAFPPSMLFEFGIGRVTSNHFMMGLGGVPVALVMNRKKFESLPAAARAIIEKNAGEKFSIAAVRQLSLHDKQVLQQLQSDSRRKVVFPSTSDAKAIQAAFDAITDQYVKSSGHNRALLAAVKREIAQVGGE